jgi:maleamate amidohydrolase
VSVTRELRASYAGVFDHRLGFGSSPAVVIVDFIKAYTAPESPLYAAPVVAAIRATSLLIERARNAGVPIIFTRVEYDTNGLDGGLFVQKVPILRTLVATNPMAAIVDELPVRDTDVVIVKQYASAFFGTSLASLLTARGVDTVIVTGCSTSGCVRATAVDGMQHGFRVVVPRECVGDRTAEPHDASLFDIDSKYGDVYPLAEVMERL